MAPREVIMNEQIETAIVDLLAEAMERSWADIFAYCEASRPEAMELKTKTSVE